MKLEIAYFVRIHCTYMRKTKEGLKGSYAAIELTQYRGESVHCGQN